MGRRTNVRMARTVQASRQRLGESQSQGARISAPRLNQAHAEKTMQSSMITPDRLLRLSLLSVRRSRYRKAYDTHAPLFWESDPPPAAFAHMPTPRSSKTRLSPRISFISKLHIGLPRLVGAAGSTRRVFLSRLWGAARARGNFSAGRFWARPMRPEPQTWRPTAARIFFEGEEE
jgi:hypothetical protein